MQRLNVSNRPRSFEVWTTILRFGLRQPSVAIRPTAYASGRVQSESETGATKRELPVVRRRSTSVLRWYRLRLSVAWAARTGATDGVSEASDSMRTDVLTIEIACQELVRGPRERLVRDDDLRLVPRRIVSGLQR